MNKRRKPNVAKTLVDNGISALFSAIEIHNKPRIDYRYPNVVILLLNSWELILKAYLYKIKGKKNILKKIETTDGNERYIGLNKCINYVFGSDVGNKLYVDSIELLYEYRNMITHAFCDDLDELIYSIISENILLLGKFLKENFGIDLGNYEENLVLLPIGVKTPFNPADFLSDQSYIDGASKDVKDFINLIRIKGQELHNAGIQDGLLVTYNMEIIGRNRVKNADFSIRIDNEADIGFSRETTLRLTNDNSAQPMRAMNLEEIRENFPIERYLRLKEWFYDNFGKDYRLFNNVYKRIKEPKNHMILWCIDPQTSLKRYSENIKDLVNKVKEEMD